MSSNVTQQFDAFDRRNGNGSRQQEDDWLDEKSIFDNEWGSTAATTFNPAEAADSDKFQDLYELHNGFGEQDREYTIRQSHIVNDAKTFMSVLAMPKIQRRRVLTVLDDLDISSNNFGGRKYEKIILALCSLVSDEALTHRLEHETNPSVDDRLFLTNRYRDLMDTTGMSSSEHRRIREQIRQKSDHF